MRRTLLGSALLVLALAGCSADVASGTNSDDATEALGPVATHHMRYLAINVGNFALGCTAYENKLCTPNVSDGVRAYITTWKPDVILISEVLDEPQLTRELFENEVMARGDAGRSLGGPILPSIAELPYAISCHPSVDRTTGKTETTFIMDNHKASHRHECVVYNTKKFALVSTGEVYGPNDDQWHKDNCNYDFTARSADLKFLDGKDAHGKDIVVTGIAVHPPSNPISAGQKRCRKDEIKHFWTDLAANKKRVFIGGDWNTQEDDELQVPSGFYANYSKGQHFTFVTHPEEWSAQYYFPLGKWQFEHAFTNFGKACTECGTYYRGEDQNLVFGSALGDYDGHPWAANPGLDHRQVLVDLSF